MTTTTEATTPTETTKKGTRVTGTARDELTKKVIAKYKSGASIREIAEDTGRSYGAIHRMVTEADVDGLLTVRSRGGKTR